MERCSNRVERRWIRFKSATGIYYYVAHLNEYVILQIWLEKNWWHWCVIGWPIPAEKEKMILRSGQTKTLRGAKIQIEEILPKEPEQLITWINL